MRMNSRMRALVGNELPSVRPDDIPPAYRAILEEGWTVSENGAYLLSALRGGYSGSTADGCEDIAHFEATVNGRGVMDYDLPAAGPERQASLLRRSIAYACLALQLPPPQKEFPILAYISLSDGGLTDRSLTSHVTFCTSRPDAQPYIDQIQSYSEEALLELSRDDTVKIFTSGEE